MTFGRVEVFHDNEFFIKDKYQGLGTAKGAVVARFACCKAETAKDFDFSVFCKWTCEQIYLAGGDLSDLSKSQLEEMNKTKQDIESRFDDIIELTDWEYISL